MQSNVEWLDSTSEAPTRLRDLDESLVNYGLNLGDEVLLCIASKVLQSIPVWSLEGSLQARFLEPVGLGWVTAYSSFGYGGKICFSLSPDKAKIVHPVGVIVFGVKADHLKSMLARQRKWRGHKQ